MEKVYEAREAGAGKIIGSSQGNGETLQRVHYVVHPRAENDETGKLVNAAVIRL